MKWTIFCCLLYCASTLTVYNNARIVPTNPQSILGNRTNVSSQINCACMCFHDAMCLSATYYGIDHLCILYFGELDRGTLRVVTTDTLASVLSFPSKTSGLSRLASLNETVYGIWNTTGGHDSHPSMPANSMSNYPLNQRPGDAFDQSVSTKYINFGTCNESFGNDNIACGRNTGLYLTLQRGSSLFVSFRFWTADSFPSRDPMNITIEGSNQPSAVLVLGSSWTLIYQGWSGIDTNLSRKSVGRMQWLVNSTIWYSSYRLLIQSKEGTGNFVQYSEFELFGY